MYQAIICKVTNLKPIPNADSLLTGKASGFDVVVGKNTEEGTLGIYFPCDGQLSENMCKKNNLFMHTNLNENSDVKGGFFEDNRRVKAITLRKCRSEGYWTELSILDWTGVKRSKLKAGDLISEINGKPICNKYYTRATRQKISQNKGKISKKNLLKASFPDFKKHKNTQKLRLMLDFVPEDAILTITEKCHGTSGRTGYMKQVKKLGKFKTWWNKHISCKFQTEEYKYVSGTRRVVIDTEKFYEGTDFRNICHNLIKAAGLAPGETVYYEIVGYDDQGGAIMDSHDIEDKKLKKVYGNKMTYSYGCSNEKLEGKYAGYDRPFKVLVYRITRTLNDGSRSELSSQQLIARCKELGLEMVPVLTKPFIYNGNPEKLMETCERLSQGCSKLDEKHIREGVVVRVEMEDIDCNYKYKSFHFCELEQIMKNNDNYVDPEEIA